MSKQKSSGVGTTLAEDVRRYIFNQRLTEDGIKLLVGVMAEVYLDTGDWDFRAAARLLQERYGLRVSEHVVRREWCHSGRRMVEDAIERMREGVLAAAEERLRNEIVKAGLDLVGDRAGLRQGGARAVRDLAEAVACLGQGRQRSATNLPPVQITFQKIESLAPEPLDVTPASETESPQQEDANA